MSLSNTAVPKYYGQFREKVFRGEILVCEEISLEMNRIDALIAAPWAYYDESKVEGWIAFCEDELTLADGGDLKLLDSFKLWGEELYGWYYFTEISVYVPDYANNTGHYVKKKIKKRLIKQQYLIVARGAAKSIYAECVQAYELVMNGKTTEQLVIAPTVDQSDATMIPLKTAITRAKGPLFNWLTAGSINNTTGNRALRPKLVATKKGIENFTTGSIIQVRPMRIDKVQGRKDTVATIDEWLSCDIHENVIGAVEQGCTKNEDYIIVCTSSEGTVRNGPGDTIKMELHSILRGEWNNPYVSIWHYKLDSIDEVNDPATWIKAQPNIGHIISYETYQQEVLKMEKAPANRNDILAKRFGIPMEGYTWFFTYEDTIPHTRIPSVLGMPCAMGADLSHGDDFTAFTFIFPDGRGNFVIKTRCYITQLNFMKLGLAMRIKYEDFLKEGSLIVLDSSLIDMKDVYEDLDSWLDSVGYDVVAFGYDPYNAEEFVERWKREHGPFCIEKVNQGARTESVPLGELKNLAEERMLIFDQLIMQFTMGNCITIEDNNGNRKLLKRHRDEKIDSVSAMLCGFVAYKLHKERFE